VPASLSLAGVLVGAVGGFVLATTYDHGNPLQRVAGRIVGGLMIAVGAGLFVAGLVR
jgi:hypothetical protein